MTYMIQIDNLIREATEEEAAALEAQRAQAEAAEQAAAAKEATRAAALKKLGLTADEVATLFG
jgi:ribosomal protein L9